jgi:hypothetical protein
MDDFHSADSDAKVEIVEELCHDFKSTWPQEYDRIGYLSMRAVCALSSKLGVSHMFVACLAGLQ